MLYVLQHIQNSSKSVTDNSNDCECRLSPGKSLRLKKSQRFNFSTGIYQSIFDRLIQNQIETDTNNSGIN